VFWESALPPSPVSTLFPPTSHPRTSLIRGGRPHDTFFSSHKKDTPSPPLAILRSPPPVISSFQFHQVDRWTIKFSEPLPLTDTPLAHEAFRLKSLISPLPFLQEFSPLMKSFCIIFLTTGPLQLMSLLSLHLGPSKYYHLLRYQTCTHFNQLFHLEFVPTWSGQHQVICTPFPPFLSLRSLK